MLVSHEQYFNRQRTRQKPNAFTPDLPKYISNTKANRKIHPNPHDKKQEHSQTSPHPNRRTAKA